MYTPPEIVEIILRLKQVDGWLARRAWFAYMYAARVNEILMSQPEHFDVEDDESKTSFYRMERSS